MFTLVVYSFLKKKNSRLQILTTPLDENPRGFSLLKLGHIWVCYVIFPAQILWIMPWKPQGSFGPILWPGSKLQPISEIMQKMLGCISFLLYYVGKVCAINNAHFSTLLYLIGKADRWKYTFYNTLFYFVNMWHITVKNSKNIFSTT